MKSAAVVSLFGLVAACAHPAPPPATPSAAPPPAVRARALALVGPHARLGAEGAIFEAEGTTALSVELDPAGALLTTEVEVPIAALPLAVARAAAARGTVTEAEVVLTADGVTFEVELATAGGARELRLDAGGAVVDDQATDDEDRAPEDDDDDAAAGDRGLPAHP